jgi:hypothetical protein
VRNEVLAGSNDSARSILRRYPLHETLAQRLNAMDKAPPANRQAFWLTLTFLLNANFRLSVVGEIQFSARLLCPVNFRYTPIVRPIPLVA